MMILAVPLQAASSAVAAREVSRFARNSRDWQQLIEMCRVVDTVLVDQLTVYAPRQGNDRLLLGFKGSLNEYELELLRQAFARRPLREGPPRRTRRQEAVHMPSIRSPSEHVRRSKQPARFTRSPMRGQFRSECRIDPGSSSSTA